MKHWYIPVHPGKIGNHKAVSHKITHELCLFGKLGEIWQVNLNTFGVLTDSVKLASKHMKQRGIYGDTFVTKLPLTELNKWCKLIKVPKSLIKQLKYAE